MKGELSRGLLIIMVVLNLAMIGYSAHYFLIRLGVSWNNWLIKDLTVLPLTLFVLAGITANLFLLNLSFPFILFYGFLYHREIKEYTYIFLFQLAMLVMMLDLIYIAGANIKLKSAKYLFWGLLGGILLLMTYHRIQFGEFNLQLPVLKVYKGLVDQVEKVF